VAEYQLYGFDATGRPKHAEVLRGLTRHELKIVAQDRLGDWQGVEVWQGPMCILRLRRSAAAAG